MKSGDERLLLRELSWLIQLRWVAGAGVVLFGLIQLRWLPWVETPLRTIGIGVAILAYNAVLVGSMRPWPQQPARRTVHIFALAQILFDLLALTLLVVSTGGIASPVASFFVFHMVFASVLLPRGLAAICAAAAIGLVAGALALAGQARLDGPWLLAMAGWAATLLVTLWLTERLARGLYQRERSRLRHYRRGRRMAAHLERQQRAMMQHEKMVAMGQLAAGVAHEITNPLASMDSLLQLMERRPGVPRPEMLESMRDQVARIEAIVRRLTGFAHPDAGRMEEANISEVVGSSLRVLALDHRLRRVQLEQHLDPVRAQVVVRSLQQVLTNLVINALDAMSDVPQPRLELRVRREGDECLIEVRDNGHGIDAKMQERIFEPFFTTKPVGQGTGLGLSISRTLVREQGGELEVSSDPGSGTTFTIRLRTAARNALPAEARDP
jgi:signal transduction histidine kinase